MSSARGACTIERVESVAFAASLLPGESEANRMALAACRDGARKEAFRDARRRAGIIREAVWIQAGPDGDVAVVFVEADDLTAAFTILRTSGEPFDRWFRDQLRTAYGLAWNEGSTMPELVLELDTNRF
jgi:hypothetical protein